MKKNGDSVRDWAGKIFRRFLSRTSLMVTLGVLGLYLICCLFYWYAEFGGPKGTAFYNVLLWNTATLFGQDYADHYPESVGGRLLGIVVLLISMFGVSAVTGYISLSAPGRRYVFSDSCLLTSAWLQTLWNQQVPGSDRHLPPPE